MRGSDFVETFSLKVIVVKEIFLTSRFVYNQYLQSVVAVEFLKINK